VTNPSPRCVIVAGPNGAGKSSVALELVQGLHGIGRYVNADIIAAGLAGFSPAIGDRRAGRIALQTIGAYMVDRSDFAFETTLSGRRWPRLLDALDAAGYSVLLHYLWSPTADLAASRLPDLVWIAAGGRGIESRIRDPAAWASISGTQGAEDA